MNFYYIFSNGNNWIKLSGDGKNPAKCSNVKFTCNEDNEDLKIVNDPISDYITAYGSVLDYADHKSNLYIQANKFGYLLKFGYSYQENNFIPFNHNKILTFNKAEKRIKVKATSKRKGYYRVIHFEDKIKEPKIEKLSEKKSIEWQEWQKYYKEKLFRPSVSPHEDYYSQVILVGSSPQHVKALISKYQAKNPSSMGIDLVADFEMLYKRTKGDVPKKSNMHIDNLTEIKLLEDSGIPNLIAGQHEGDTYICKFIDGSKAIHKVMEKQNIAGEVGTYEISKILNWDIIPETIQCDYKEGEGSTQKWIKDGIEPTGDFLDGIDLKEKHLDDLSKIFILDMITGNSDRHEGNIIIDPNRKCWGIDNEAIGSNNAKTDIESLKLFILGNIPEDEFETEYFPMLRVLENSFGNDQQMYQKFKDCIDNNLIRVRNHGNKIINYWNKNDNIDNECKKNIINNINYLNKYYTDRWEINKSIKIILPFKKD